MYLSIAVNFLDEADEIEEVPRRRLRDISNVLEMPTKQFVAYFRVTKEIFTNILTQLDPKWLPAHRSTRIRPDIKLGTFLRFLATGGYQQSVGNESISSTSKTTVCRVIAECLELFETFICPQWIKMPLTEEEQATIEQAFWDKYGFPGIVGCVDGTHIHIKAPSTDDKYLYYNRHGFYSLNAMVVCDHNMIIRSVDARYPGSNLDSFIWENSDANRKLKSEFDGGKKETWILGDGGYKLLPYLMTPFRNPSTTDERRYNQKHISARSVVERCVGVLKNRFRCIIGTRGLHYDPDKAIRIVNVCCALHNICIEYKCPEVSSTLPEVGECSSHDEPLDGLDSRAVTIRKKISINL